MELLDAAYISQLYLWCHCLEIYTHHQVYQIIYLSGLIWWHVHCRFVLYRTHGKTPTFVRSLFLSIYVLQPCRHTGSHVQLVVLLVFIFFFFFPILYCKNMCDTWTRDRCVRGENKKCCFSPVMPPSGLRPWLGVFLCLLSFFLCSPLPLSVCVSVGAASHHSSPARSSTPAFNHARQPLHIYTPDFQPLVCDPCHCGSSFLAARCFRSTSISSVVFCF